MSTANGAFKADKSFDVLLELTPDNLIAVFLCYTIPLLDRPAEWLIAES